LLFIQHLFNFSCTYTDIASNFFVLQEKEQTDDAEDIKANECQTDLQISPSEMTN
jgi:hypothetical protein